MKTGVELIADERLNQIKKGWTAEHDDRHRAGELAEVAATVAANDTDLTVFGSVGDWGIVSRHRTDRIRQLAIAGALIAAEIDRFIRGNSQ